MNRKLYLAYILFSLAAFCAVTGWACFRFFIIRSANIERGEQTADAFKDATVNAFQVHGTLDNGEVQTDLKRRILAAGNIRLVSVYLGDNLKYLYAADKSYIGYGSNYTETWPAAPVYRFNKALERSFSRSFLKAASQGSPGGIHTVDVLVSLISRDFLFLIIRDALIGYGALFLITCIFIIIASSVREKIPVSAGTVSSPPASVPPEGAVFESPPQGTEMQPTTPAAMDGPPKDMQAGDPRCMYSPASGLGWMQYLEEKLSFELRRAASFDQDLTLVLLTAKQAKRGEESYKVLADYILEQFHFQDLAFEYLDRGFAVIVPNADLDQVTANVHAFVQGMKKRSALAIFDVTVGLTSRNGRLIAGGRMLSEAKKALAKAEAEGELIIGFRTDPIKYRQYIASKA